MHLLAVIISLAVYYKLTMMMTLMVMVIVPKFSEVNDNVTSHYVRYVIR